MYQVFNKLMLHHARLLLQRKWKKSIFQSLPSIMVSFLLAQITFITETIGEAENYVWIYFALALTVTFLVSIVIYYREAAMELKSFSYLSVTGYKKQMISLIVFMKWLFLFNAGFIMAMLTFFLFNLKGLIGADKGMISGIVCYSFFFNLILLAGIILAIFNFRFSNER